MRYVSFFTMTRVNIGILFPVLSSWRKKRNMLKTNIVWHVHNGSGLCRLRRRVCCILRSHGMQVYVWFKFSFLSTLFNIQLVAAVPGGCNSQLQENAENQHGLTCSQWQWIVHMQVGASSLLHFAFTYGMQVMFDSSFRFCQPFSTSSW